MKKEPLTMKQKYKIFNIGRIIGYVLMILGLMTGGINSALLWIGFALFIALSVFRIFTIRCPECDELLVSNFGRLSKKCAKCGWDVEQEDVSQDENA